jgi:spore coat polysaccharide biosynthesis protein SpsF
MTSTRLPGKVLRPLGDTTVLGQVIRRARRAPGVDAVQVALPEGADHDAVAREARRHGPVGITRGSEHDVLGRTLRAARDAGAATVLRLTSDCPLLDPGVAGAVVALRRACGVPYAATALEHGYPVGFDAEAIAVGALAEADARATAAYEREHVTPYLWRRPERFACAWLDRSPDRRAWRLAVDAEADLRLVRAVHDALAPADPDFGFAAVEALLQARPALLATNHEVPQTPYEGAAVASSARASKASRS